MRTLVARSNNGIFPYPEKDEENGSAKCFSFGSRESFVSPHVVLGLLMLHHAHPAAQATVIHAATQAPLIAFRVVHLDGFQIGSPVEATHSVKLAVHNRQANLLSHMMKRIQTKSTIQLTPDLLEVIATIGAQEFVIGLEKEIQKIQKNSKSSENSSHLYRSAEDNSMQSSRPPTA